MHKKSQGKQICREKKVTKGVTLPGKLSDCVSSNYEETELFLVEGDSAGVQRNKLGIETFKLLWL